MAGSPSFPWLNNVPLYPGGGDHTWEAPPEPSDSPRPHLAQRLVPSRSALTAEQPPLLPSLSGSLVWGAGGFRAAGRALGAQHMGCCAQVAVLCRHSAPSRPDSLRGRTLLRGPWACGAEARQWGWGAVHSRDPLNPGQALGRLHNLTCILWTICRLILTMLKLIVDREAFYTKVQFC